MNIRSDKPLTADELDGLVRRLRAEAKGTEGAAGRFEEERFKKIGAALETLGGVCDLAAQAIEQLRTPRTAATQSAPIGPATAAHDAMVRDAGRYRWLRLHHKFANDSMREIWFDSTIHHSALKGESASDLDRAIDEAAKANSGDTITALYEGPWPSDAAATYVSERAALVRQVGDCCQGNDPLCTAGCLVEKALRKRGLNVAGTQINAAPQADVGAGSSLSGSGPQPAQPAVAAPDVGVAS